MSVDKLAQFSKQKYVNLETFKKSGQAVRTPLWFVEREGVLYMRTPAASAKVRRIRNNQHVRVVPSDVRGNPLGLWQDGEAHLIDADDAEWVNDLIKRKYGLLKRLIDIRSRLRGTKAVVIAVRV
jgi:PPOX class probable F420-dependent enzyme